MTILHNNTVLSNEAALFPDLAPLVGPGLYQIRCKENNRTYIGETQNLLERLGKHVAVLEKNVSDSPEMQKDWNRFGKRSFEITVLELGIGCLDTESRKRIEKELISKLSEDPERTYNVLPGSRRSVKNCRTICEIDGVVYDSIANAAKALGSGETTIRRKLRSPAHTSYKKLREVPTGYSSLSVDGTVYNSLGSVVDAGLADSTQIVMRRLKSEDSRWKGWFYISSAYRENRKLYQSQR